MAHRIDKPEETAAGEADPPDIHTMRETARLALADAPDTDDLSVLAETLRGHLRVLIPAVSELATTKPRDELNKFCARAGVAEAQNKLRMGDGDALAIRVSVVQKLARSVTALCNHYERLTPR